MGQSPGVSVGTDPDVEALWTLLREARRGTSNNKQARLLNTIAFIPGRCRSLLTGSSNGFARISKGFLIDLSRRSAQRTRHSAPPAEDNLSDYRIVLKVGRQRRSVRLCRTLPHCRLQFSGVVGVASLNQALRACINEQEIYRVVWGFIAGVQKEPACAYGDDNRLQMAPKKFPGRIAPRINDR